MRGSETWLSCATREVVATRVSQLRARESSCELQLW